MPSGFIFDFRAIGYVKKSIRVSVSTSLALPLGIVIVTLCAAYKMDSNNNNDKLYSVSSLISIFVPFVLHFVTDCGCQ